MTTRRPSTRLRGCHAGWSSTRRSTASDRVRPIATSAGDGVARGSRRSGTEVDPILRTGIRHS